MYLPFFTFILQGFGQVRKEIIAKTIQDNLSSRTRDLTKINTRYLDLSDVKDKDLLEAYERFMHPILLDKCKKDFNNIKTFLHKNGKYLLKFGLPYGYGKFVWDSTVATVSSIGDLLKRIC